MNNIIKRENGRQPATFGSVVDQIFQSNLDRFFDDDFWGSGSSGKTKGFGNVPTSCREQSFRHGVPSSSDAPLKFQ